MTNEKIHYFTNHTSVFYYYPEEEVINKIDIYKDGRKKKCTINFDSAELAFLFFDKLPQRADFRSKGETNES